MKKIVYLILAAITAFLFSSYIYPTSKEKIKVGKDSLSLNINLNNKIQNNGSYKLETNNKWDEVLNSTLELNREKLNILKEMKVEQPIKTEYIPTTAEVILEKYGFKKKFIVKRIRNDTIIKIWSILCISIWITILIRRLKNIKEDWKPLLIRGLFIIVSLVISTVSLYYLSSFILNREF